MKKTLLLTVSFAIITLINYSSNKNDEDKTKSISLIKTDEAIPTQIGKKKTIEEKRASVEGRIKFEFDMQVNPATGVIPREEKLQEKAMSREIMLRGVQSRATSTSYETRGPSNLGGRTRSLVIDISDNTGNTILAGGVSGGVFRTTNGGASWTKVSPNGEIHNVTSIAQDPRPGFQNKWYYGTGELLGSSASNVGAFYLGRGIWESIDSGLTWTQIPGTNSTQEGFNNHFDLIHNLAVSPNNGDLFAANTGRISRYNGTSWATELESSFISSHITDIAIGAGHVYASFSGNSGAFGGVWSSPTGNGSWTRIGFNGYPVAWSNQSRIVLGVAPSNEDILYALYVNGNNNTNVSPAKEADLWRWDEDTSTWTNYSAKLPDEADLPYDSMTGANAGQGNDPFSVQGGYDLVVSVKPDDEDFVVIGGTNAYKIADIVTDAAFTRIGGYASPDGYSLYNVGDVHHPDIHALVFNPFNATQLFSGTDGGIHRTNNINATSVSWTHLNNNYQTYQYYHVGIDQQNGSDGVIGGAQDNGTTYGGTVFNLPNTTEMSFYFGGDGVSVAISRDNACTPFFYGAQNGFLLRDCPGATALITPSGSSSQFVTYFHLDPDNNNALYYAGFNTIYRTTASSSVTSGTWTTLGTTIDLGAPVLPSPREDFVRFATTRGAYNPATSYLLMGTNTGDIFRLNDPQNVANLSTAVNITPSGTLGFCTGLAIHPTNPDIVMVTYSNYGVTNIFMTTNATAANPNWAVVERNLALFSIRSAMITEASGETNYFVGTARGLYSSPNPATTDWNIETPSQIGFAVVSSMDYRPSDNKLLIGTHGNGMYMGTVSGTLSVDSFEDKRNLTLYPNPAISEIRFNLEENSFSDVGYSIFSLTGKKVNTGILSNENKIDIESLNAGIYIVELKLGNKISTGKFIKK